MANPALVSNHHVADIGNRNPLVDLDSKQIRNLIISDPFEETGA
jgi:hypothetical protein